MLQIELNMYQAVAVAALVLLLGRFLVSKIPFLTKYCIPEPGCRRRCLRSCSPDFKIRRNPRNLFRQHFTVLLHDCILL